MALRGGWSTRAALAGWASIAALGALETSNAGAQPGPELAHHVKASLVGETRNIVPGQALPMPQASP